MLGGRPKLPLIAEISAATNGEGSVWSLRRNDLDRLEGVLEQVGERRVVMVCGREDLVPALAVGLAGAACAAGRRTILVESDLAQPRLAAGLGLSPSPGLHEYLRWEATAADVLQPLALAGSRAPAAGEPLVCVVAGRPAPDPGTLLGLQSFRHMAAKLRAAYDLVVFSGPKIVSDPTCLDAIAAEADGFLMAISPSGDAEDAPDLVQTALSRLSTAPIGAVVVAA